MLDFEPQTNLMSSNSIHLGSTPRLVSPPSSTGRSNDLSLHLVRRNHTYHEKGALKATLWAGISIQLLIVYIHVHNHICIYTVYIYIFNITWLSAQIGSAPSQIRYFCCVPVEDEKQVGSALLWGLKFWCLDSIRLLRRKKRGLFSLMLTQDLVKPLLISEIPSE